MRGGSSWSEDGGGERAEGQDAVCVSDGEEERGMPQNGGNTEAKGETGS